MQTEIMICIVVTESSRTTEQLKQDKEQDLQKVHSVKPPQQVLES